MRRYPDCPVITKSIVVGGLSKADLIQKLQQSSISLNQYGERLLYDDRFTITETAYSVEIVELSVRDLGFRMAQHYLKSLDKRTNWACSYVRLSWDHTYDWNM